MRRRSRIAGLAAVAARYCVSREARASFQVQVSRCDPEPGSEPAAIAESSTRAPCARSLDHVGAASIRRTMRSIVLMSG